VATTTENFTLGTYPLDQNEWDSLAFDFVKSCKNRKPPIQLSLKSLNSFVAHEH
jgi:hypothetical protein